MKKTDSCLKKSNTKKLEQKIPMHYISCPVLNPGFGDSRCSFAVFPSVACRKIGRNISKIIADISAFLPFRNGADAFCDFCAPIRLFLCFLFGKRGWDDSSFYDNKNNTTLFRVVPFPYFSSLWEVCVCK